MHCRSSPTYPRPNSSSNCKCPDECYYLELYLHQRARYVCGEHKSRVAGIFPIAIDKESGAGYCWLGRANIGRRESRNNREYFYSKKSDGQVIGVRNVLCHFHGWVDMLESNPQAKAREGYEESRGLFGSYVDLWRCLSLEGFSYTLPCIPMLSVIYLGKMTLHQRNDLVKQFYQCPVNSPCMTETRGVHFISLKELHRALYRSYHFNTRTSMHDVDPSTFPDDSVWLRPFLHDWMTELVDENDEEDGDLAEDDRNIGKTKDFHGTPKYPPRPLPQIPPNMHRVKLPAEIHSGWHGGKLVLVSRPTASSCFICDHDIREACYRGPSTSRLNTSGNTYYHVQCLLDYNSKTNTCSLKDDLSLSRACYRFEFFEDPLIKSILEGDGCESKLRAISDLPIITDVVERKLHAMLMVSEEVCREYELGKPVNHKLTHRLTNCIDCGDKIYVKKEDATDKCRACKDLADYKHKRSTNLVMDGSRDGNIRCHRENEMILSQTVSGPTKPEPTNFLTSTNDGWVTVISKKKKKPSPLNTNLSFSGGGSNVRSQR